MFTDKTSVRSVLIAFFGYLVVAAVVMVIVVQRWMPTGVTDQQQLARMAEVDPSLLMWQNALGAILCVAAGFAACHFSGARGLKNPLLLGVLLALYGVLGIFLHPGHPPLMQAAKLVAPVPLALLGGWLRLRLSAPAVAAVD